MQLLALKLVLTPLLVGGSALAARRWGPAVGGWLIALPLTSGPVLAFLALDQGPAFASAAAVGAITGMAAIAAYAVAYRLAARRGAGSGVALGVAALAFVGAGVALGPARSLPLGVVAGIALGAIAVAGRIVRPSGVAHGPVPHPRWDVPARVLLATAIVLALTAVAPLVGAGWSGVVATFPVYISVLVAFTHRHAGPIGAADVLAGTLVGMPGTVAFYVAFILVLAALPLPLALAAACAATLAVEAIVLPRALASGIEPEPA